MALEMYQQPLDWGTVYYPTSKERLHACANCGLILSMEQFDKVGLTDSGHEGGCPNCPWSHDLIRMWMQKEAKARGDRAPTAIQIQNAKKMLMVKDGNWSGTVNLYTKNSWLARSLPSLQAHRHPGMYAIGLTQELPPWFEEFLPFAQAQYGAQQDVKLRVRASSGDMEAQAQLQQIEGAANQLQLEDDMGAAPGDVPGSPSRRASVVPNVDADADFDAFLDNGM